MLNLPSPSRDSERFVSMRERGMTRFPERHENYQKYLSMIKEPFCETMPTILDIEPSNRCNFNCPMCITSLWRKDRPLGDMSMELFTQIMEAQYGVMEVKLQGLGEPLLNKNLASMVQYCTDYDIWTRTTSNGTFITQYGEAIVNAGIGELQISFDGATEKTFSAIRPGSSFTNIVRDIEAFHKNRRETCHKANTSHGCGAKT